MSSKNTNHPNQIESDKVSIIKTLFNNFYTQIRTSGTYNINLSHIKHSIKEGCFTNIYGYKNGQNCIYGLEGRIEFVQQYKDFIQAFLSNGEYNKIISKLVEEEFELLVFRSVKDNEDIQYFPSKFNEGSEYIQMPFSTSLNPNFANKWIEGYDCCIYVIKVNFSHFREFMNGDDELEYIPLMYLDSDQEEITLGPGELVYNNQYTIKNKLDGNKEVKCIVLDYYPVPINKEWKKYLYTDCSKL